MNLKCTQYFLILLHFLIFSFPASARKHNLILTNDSRRHVSLSTFGFFIGGQLDVNLKHFTFAPYSTNSLFGFMLTRAYSDAVTPFVENQQEKCLLQDPALYNDASINLISFALDFHRNLVHVNCSQFFDNLKITHDADFMEDYVARERRDISVKTSDSFLMTKQKRQAPPSSSTNTTTPKPIIAETTKLTTTTTTTPKTAVPVEEVKTPTVTQVQEDLPAENTCPYLTFPLHKVGTAYNLRFHISIDTPKAEGLYNLYFHNCAGREPTRANLTVSMIEVNLMGSDINFLSAGEIPLPRLYFMMSLVFFTTFWVWIYVLRKKRDEAFKIHYLMGLLVAIKSASLMFHGINYYFIAKDGFPMEAWAVLYYITHLLKGALLFITIVLVGTGWAFIKHILSEQDKKIFMLVIPLQVLANVAKIIMEESEEGESTHTTWREVFIFVDLLCCGAILFPVVWSIRHLQEASQTDGKAAINLEKLKLFRHFYIMIVCYIYFTRIIVFLLKITVPFQYEWLDELFREVATLIFFIMTGYNFRPTPSNPYFRLSNMDEDDMELDQVVSTKPSETGLRSRVEEGAIAAGSTMSKRESSHEYD